MVNWKKAFLSLHLALLFLSVAQATVQDSWVDYMQDGLLRVFDAVQRTRRQAEPAPKEGESRKAHARLTFEDCGNAEDPFLFDYVKVDPNPVVFPGKVSISFGLQVRENKTSPIKAEITMSKKVSLLFGLTTWFDIPCLGNGVGSCTLDNICDQPVIREGLCRRSEDQNENTCGCPFIQGNYTTKPVSFEIPEFPDDVPGYLLRGEFYVKGVFSKDGQDLTCYSSTLDLEI